MRENAEKMWTRRAPNTDSFYAVNVCFKHLTCMTYSLRSCKLATSFSTFQYSVLLVKMINHDEDIVNFYDIEQ